MSSERLYYTDAYLLEFDAVVRDVEPAAERWKVILDRTAFYPTSGGQPCDTGTLGDARVLEVLELEDGSVAHFADRALETNDRVRGRIDWDRRFDHMQQHTGQHLLSAAFDRELGAKTVSFHLGGASATIDVDKDLTAAQIAQAETAANRILWEDHEVCTTFVTAAEAATLPLRKDPTRTGELRIIDITNYDLSACGGTHVRSTGAIGVVVIAGAERFKGGTRVEFLCGGRALHAYRALKGAVSGGVRLLSVLPEELPGAIEKLQTASRAQQKSLDAVYERLAVYEGATLASNAEQVGTISLVARAVSGWDANGLKRMASAIASAPGKVAVLVTAESPSLIVVARSPELALDAGVILKSLIERFGGKGGGRGAMAQGGGLTGPPDAILAAARELVSA